MKQKKLGEILVETGLISEVQLNKTLEIQENSEDLPIGQVLVREGFISQRDLNVALDYYDKRLKLGEILISRKIITYKQLEYTLGLSKKKKLPLGKLLVQLNMVSEEKLAEALSTQYDMPFLALKGISLSPGLNKYINKSYAVKHRVAVVKKTDKSITLAMAIPLGPIELAELENAIMLNIVGAIATDSDITYAHDQIYGVSGSEKKTSKEIELSLEDFVEDERQSKYLLQHNIVHLVKKLLTTAVNAEASDIHLENTEDGMFVRFRIDGVLQCLDLNSCGEEIRKHGPSLVSKIKLQCDLDIAERRRPQDGSFRVQVSSGDRKRTVDFRVSIIPTRFGENVVIRILDKVRPLALESIGFPDNDFKELKHLLENPTGIYLVTGPTGSGKTSTLYSILNTVSCPDVKILTAEDPIEYSVGNISQCEVNEKIGNSFANLLRSFLRQDPDFIMVGEMRDLETCSIAIRAALTGHTVLSTLHTNDATSAITRLIDMKIDPTLLATTLRGVIAQRLVRANCIHCREAYQPQNELLEKLPEPFLKSIKHLRGSGCAMCNYTGFSGRRLISEVWFPTREESFAISRISDNQELRKIVFDQTDRKTMFQNGLDLVRNGETTFDELLRNVPSEQVTSFINSLKNQPQKKFEIVPAKL